MAAFVKWFDELTKNDLAIAGGKGANLGEMLRAGIPVPPGFTVTAEAYKEFITHSDLAANIITTLAKIKVDDAKQLEKAAEELGKSPGAGLGTGMVLIPQVMTPTGPVQAPVAALMICSKCAAKVPATSKFCSECGETLSPPTTGTVKCRKCDKLVPSGSKFCLECGAKIE